MSYLKLVFLSIKSTLLLLFFVLQSEIVQAGITKKSNLMVPVFQSMTRQEIQFKAERLTNNHIELFFSQNPEIDRLRLDVMGEKASEIVPMFSVSISRSQWLKSPHIKSWVSYNQASFSLLQSNPSLVARREGNPLAANGSSSTVARPIGTSEINSLINQGFTPLQLIDKGVSPQLLVDELD